MLRRAVESTLLAFDYGEKRIGVAVGNLLTRHAQALAVIENRNRACRFAALGALLTEWQPQALVVGLPTHPDGAPHVMTQQALRFGRQLKGRFGLPVLWVDERYSSVSAAAQRDAAPLDAIAARIILQQFFDEYAREPSAIERAR
ncbi:putative holliday junction resolvase [Candidatus Glomeribacter gigasporarum BEG34]|uniref:Putative pre-16S rRNA nuclease n=1 Tax=Candidatus Glomeribacter gigasporarum BEG34 TaxID=1070319 RepID=G2J8I9_9BURK|nr:Holliday junction resolvase RuvX [Candidatus Glomeribacter gigasporarum]CCD29086.1 putative holliday junction resolvase [Candidatus Glomeribacter gigasporarum BEG34]